jgi:hypothetical protein
VERQPLRKKVPIVVAKHLTQAMVPAKPLLDEGRLHVQSPAKCRALRQGSVAESVGSLRSLLHQSLTYQRVRTDASGDWLTDVLGEPVLLPAGNAGANCFAPGH